MVQKKRHFCRKQDKNTRVRNKQESTEGDHMWLFFPPAAPSASQYLKNKRRKLKILTEQLQNTNVKIHVKALFPSPCS